MVDIDRLLHTTYRIAGAVIIPSLIACGASEQNPTCVAQSKVENKKAKLKNSNQYWEYLITTATPSDYLPTAQELASKTVELDQIDLNAAQENLEEVQDEHGSCPTP